MYTVMIRVGDARKIKRAVFEDAAKAEEYFKELCQRRTDYPATAVNAAHTVYTLADLDQPSTEAARQSVPAE